MIQGTLYYFRWRHLPNLNYDNPEVRRWIMEAFSYWVRESDVDGFRADAAWGVKLRRPDFWPEWQGELKRIKPDLLLLAEASARDPYYFSHGFGVAYDWNDGLGHWALEHVFDDPDQLAARLHTALTNEGRGLHEDALIFRFINNDTGLRFITRYGVEMEKVAAALLLALPGLPCIYTGQEVGAELEPYKTLAPIPWQDRHGLRGHYKLLIWLRKRFASLHSRRWRVVPAESRQQAHTYLRYGEAQDQPVLVVLNFSRTQARVELGVPARFSRFRRARKLTDLLSGRQVPIRSAAPGRAGVVLPKLSAHLLVDEDAPVRPA